MPVAAELDDLGKAHQLIGSYLDEVKQAKDNILVANVDEQGRAYVVIKTNDNAGVEKAFDWLRQAGKINPAAPVVRF